MDSSSFTRLSQHLAYGTCSWISGELDKFCLSLAAFIFEKSTHNILPEDSTYYPREDVKHIACGMAVIQVFTCESLNVGRSARKQKSLSQQDIYQMNCPLTSCPFNRKCISANHTQVCLGDGCALDVTAQQCNTD